jgi:hypothetical protein
VQAAQEHGVGLLVSMVLHNIAQTSDEGRRYGINTICFKFDWLLNDLKDSGLVLIDRFSDSQIDAQLVKMFSVGLLDMPFSDKVRPSNIVGFHY